MILYKLDASPFTSTSLMSLLDILQSEDGVLFTQDASYILRHSSLLAGLKGSNASLYVLEADVKARGLQVEQTIKTIDYDQMVELCLHYDKVISW